VGLIIASLFTPLFSSLIQRSFLGGIDQGVGFVFGAVRGIALAGAAFLIYDMAHQSVAMVDQSRSAKIYANFDGGLQGALPEDLLGMVMERYNALTQTCQGNAALTGDINGTATPTPAGN